MKTFSNSRRDAVRIIALGTGAAVGLPLVTTLSACGGGSTSTTDSLVTGTLPTAPTNLSVVRTPSQTLSATVSWTAPTSGGAPTTYEIYRSTTAGTAFDPSNHLISIAVVSGQTSYSFIDDAGLSAVDTYWVVSSKNGRGEAASAEVSYKPVGPASGGDTSFGNNLSVPMIFADGVGITGLLLDTTKAWTTDVATLDYNTGLRPLTGLLPSTQTTLPYFNSADTYTLDGVAYYQQGTSSTWQAEWLNGATTQHTVTATWGDNLLSQNLTTSSVIRVECALTEDVTTAMAGYNMKSLYGTNANEVQGTDGTGNTATTVAVFAANAHLRIDKLDSSGRVVYTPYDQTLWAGDGPGFFAGEVTVSGGFTYGFVLQLKNLTPPTGVTLDGTWRLTFSLDNTSPAGTTNNTVIGTATNGVLDSSSQVHIDIIVTA